MSFTAVFSANDRYSKSPVAPVPSSPDPFPDEHAERVRARAATEAATTVARRCVAVFITSSSKFVAPPLKRFNA
ncbi:hypothetical protein AAG589_19095 [Isoptericola sp. F-RaC21]|uniref:hypothetical protein n=1 Tax=Isoptericola sp. F-RaC21 TaxID=3141452 RepID=UPI00315C14AD